MENSSESQNDPSAIETEAVAAAAVAAERVKVVDLKKELLRVVREIVEEGEDDGVSGIGSIAKIDAAAETLRALRDSMKLKKKKSFTASMRTDEELGVPAEFRCPLSNELMRDPVVLESGQTYDRQRILKWLSLGNRTCPRTQQVLSHTILTPNNLVRELILKWCKNRGIELSELKDGEHEKLPRADRERLRALLDKMSSIHSDKKEAAKELRSMTKSLPSIRAFFCSSPDAIPRLLRSVSQSQAGTRVDYDLEEDLITTILNISIHESNKKLVAETPDAISVLNEALAYGTMATRSNAAAALFTLSALDSNKELIGKSGAMKLLINLLDEGNPLAMKDAASALFSLCIHHDNKERATKRGAVGIILKKIRDGVQVDRMLSLLANLSAHFRAVNEMGQLQAVPLLLGILRSSTSGQIQENCISILHDICFDDRTKWGVVKEEEKTYKTITKLSQCATMRGKRKAEAMLRRMTKAVTIVTTRTA